MPQSLLGRLRRRRRARRLRASWRDAGLLKRERPFRASRPGTRSRARGLGAIGSPLPAPGDRPARLRARRRRRVAVARRPRRSVRAARRDRRRAPAPLARRRAASPAPSRPGYAARLAFGPHGRERLHYPDLLLRTADGRRVALELELTPKTRTRLETDPRRLRRRSPVRRRRLPGRRAALARRSRRRRGGSGSRRSSTSSACRSTVRAGGARDAPSADREPRGAHRPRRRGPRGGPR